MNNSKRFNPLSTRYSNVLLAHHKANLKKSNHYQMFNTKNPKSIERIVTGTPIFKYSRKLILTLGEALSITIMLAIEPSIVKLPANVELMAR